MQFVGGAIPALLMWRFGRAEELAGNISRFSVRLAWHDALHNPLGIAGLVAGVAFVVTGSVLLARPFVRRRRTLLVAVPIAAIAGFLILGAFIGVIALIAWLAYVSEGALFPDRRWACLGRAKVRKETSAERATPPGG